MLTLQPESQHPTNLREFFKVIRRYLNRNGLSMNKFLVVFGNYVSYRTVVPQLTAYGDGSWRTKALRAVVFSLKQAR